jgi:hypothetical protein
MNIDSEKMTKMAGFVAAAAPKLEKLAAQEAALDKNAPQWVDGLINQGLLKKEARDTAIAELRNGGIDKIAEVIEYLIGNVGPQSTGKPVEKTASTDVKGKRQSDILFEQALLG